MIEWIVNIAWLLAGVCTGYFVYVAMSGYRADLSCRCGKVQIHGKVSSADVTGLVQRVERSCPQCRTLLSSDSCMPHSSAESRS